MPALESLVAHISCGEDVIKEELEQKLNRAISSET